MKQPEAQLVTNNPCVKQAPQECEQIQVEAQPNNLPPSPETVGLAIPKENYDYTISHSTLPCCSMVQLNITGKPPASAIRRAVENHHQPFSGGRRVFMVNVLIPGEERLQKALLDYGFVEVAEFSRRYRYSQSVRIKMYLYEPESTENGIVTNSSGIAENKIVLP